MLENLNISVDGHVKIWNPESQEVFVDKHNAINPETMSILIANAIASYNNPYIYEMHFGNGGTIIDETGNITYKDVTVNLENGVLAGLFNATYFQVVDKDERPELNPNPTKNKIAVDHTEGLNYSDVIITCTIERSDPSTTSLGNLTVISQENLDEATSFDGEFVFDEIGLKSKGADGINTGQLLTHIVFHPVQKSANRVIQVVYTLRIRIV
jgi:hypothetical protein